MRLTTSFLEEDLYPDYRVPSAWILKEMNESYIGEIIDRNIALEKICEVLTDG